MFGKLWKVPFHFRDLSVLASALSLVSSFQHVFTPFGEFIRGLAVF
jgi:hypothetical protein